MKRSALALKLMTFAPTGAIVAAITTSLPEEIGGERNWDYRFCWVRDASFALYALSVLGYSGEAKCFHDFLLSSGARSLPNVRPMYGIDGALKLDEVKLDHLEGYRASTPVRCGNGAYLQHQSDAYGQMLDLALMYEALGRGDFLARYLGEDGLEGGEGAFLVCGSWLADAELAAGRTDVARARIERLVACANDVGLYAEEIDVASGGFLGNFPQALTHLGLIGNLVNLKLAEKGGTAALAGSYADRARRAVRATFGWRGFIAAMQHSRRVGRVFSSKRSKLAWP